MTAVRVVFTVPIVLGSWLGIIFFLSTGLQPRYIALVLFVLSQVIVINWLGITVFSFMFLWNNIICCLCLLYLHLKLDEEESDRDGTMVISIDNQEFLRVTLLLLGRYEGSKRYAQTFSYFWLHLGLPAVTFLSAWFFVTPFGLRIGSDWLFVSLISGFTLGMLLVRCSGGRRFSWKETFKSLLNSGALNPSYERF